MKFRYFKEMTTIEEVNKNYLVYRFIDKAKTAEEIKYDSFKLYREIKRFVLFLKEKGYFSEEIMLHNILITKDGIKFIDLDGIVKYNKNKHDIQKTLKKIKDEISKIKVIHNDQ
jgi:azurin